MRYHYYERWKVVLLVCVLAFAFCAAAAGGAFLWLSLIHILKNASYFCANNSKKCLNDNKVLALCE